MDRTHEGFNQDAAILMKQGENEEARLELSRQIQALTTAIAAEPESRPQRGDRLLAPAVLQRQIVLDSRQRVDVNRTVALNKLYEQEQILLQERQALALDEAFDNEESEDGSSEEESDQDSQHAPNIECFPQTKALLRYRAVRDRTWQ